MNGRQLSTFSRLLTGLFSLEASMTWYLTRLGCFALIPDGWAAVALLCFANSGA